MFTPSPRNIRPRPFVISLQLRKVEKNGLENFRLHHESWQSNTQSSGGKKSSSRQTTIFVESCRRSLRLGSRIQQTEDYHGFPVLCNGTPLIDLWFGKDERRRGRERYASRRSQIRRVRIGSVWNQILQVSAMIYLSFNRIGSKTREIMELLRRWAFLHCPTLRLLGVLVTTSL
jgi:hypothetical protein